MAKTKKTEIDYEEWKSLVVNRFKDKSAIVDALWNEIYTMAVRDGYDDYMEADEADFSEILEILVTDAR